MKAVLPGRITQNGDLLAVFVFLGGEHAAKQRLNCQGAEHACRQARGIHISGFAGAGKLISGEFVSAQGRKRLGLAGIGTYIRHRNARLAVAAYVRLLNAVREHHQPVRIWKGKRPQQNALDDGENRRGGSNAERQHEHSGGREAR